MSKEQKPRFTKSNIDQFYGILDSKTNVNTNDTLGIIAWLNELNAENERLKEQIEEMKCCGNCKKQYHCEEKYLANGCNSYDWEWEKI